MSKGTAPDVYTGDCVALRAAQKGSSQYALNVIQPHYKEIIMEEQVLKAMKEAGKPVRPGDIAKVLGVDSKEVSKACAELKKAGKIYSPKRCYYEPVAE